MTTLALTVALGLLAVPPQGPPSSQPNAQPAAQQHVLRHVPVREWMAVAPPPPVPPLGSLLAVNSRANLTPLDLLGAAGAGPRRQLEPEALLTLARALAPQAFDDGTLSMALVGATLQVAGPADLAAQVERRIGAMTRAMVHHVQLEARLFRIAERRQLPVVVGPGQLAQLTAGLEEIWSGTAACQSGNATGLGLERATWYVRDIGAEVAEGSKIGDPDTAALFEGVMLAVEPHVLAGSDDLVLRAQFALGEQRAPLQLRASGIDDMPSLDVPMLDCASGAFSGRIANGGALLVALQGDAASGLRMLLTLSAAARRGEAEVGEDIAAYPVSALLSRALRTSVRTTAEAPLSWSVESDDSRGLGPRDRESLETLLLDSIPLQEGEQLWLWGGHAVVQGGAATRRAVAQLVGALQEQLLRNAAVELRTAMGAGGFGRGAFPAASTSTPGEQRLLHELSLPALVGHPHVVVRGCETTAISDIDVEIAQKASVSNPVVTRVFSGVVCSLFVYPQVEGVGGEIEVDVVQTDPLVRRPRETKDGGDLYLPRQSRSHYAHSGPLSLGEELPLGQGPAVELDDRRYRTVQTVRITTL